eukprot:10384780-Alexandrium_andersonii.AAC.1
MTAVGLQDALGSIHQLISCLPQERLLPALRAELLRFRTAILRPDWCYLEPTGGWAADSGTAPGSRCGQGRAPNGIIGFD